MARLVVLVTTGLPDHLDGYVRRFMFPVSSSILVGSLSTGVATGLWDRIIRAVGDGAATMLVADHSREQGFRILSHGDRAPLVADLDGLSLFARRSSTSRPLEPVENEDAHQA